MADNRQTMVIKKLIPDVNGNKLEFVRIEEVIVHPFITEAAEATVDLGMTQHIQNRDFATYDIFLSRPCYAEEIESVTSELHAMVLKRLGLEAQTFKQDVVNGLKSSSSLDTALAPMEVKELPEGLVEVKRGDKTIHVHVFKTKAARVGVGFHLTLEVPNHESIKARFQIVMPCYAEEQPYFLDKVVQMVRRLIETEGAQIDAYRVKRAKDLEVLANTPAVPGV